MFFLLVVSVPPPTFWSPRAPFFFCHPSCVEWVTVTVGKEIVEEIASPRPQN